MKKPLKRPTSVLTGTLSLDRAAQRLNVSPHELRRRLGKGELPFVQVRGRIRVPKEALSG